MVPNLTQVDVGLGWMLCCSGGGILVILAAGQDYDLGETTTFPSSSLFSYSSSESFNANALVCSLPRQAF